MLALTKYGRTAASTRQRFLQFGPALADAGFCVEFAPLLGDEHMQRLARGQKAGAGTVLRAYARRIRAVMKARRYDLLWIQYEVFPFAPGVLDTAFLRGKPVVLDYDDAIFHGYDDARSPLVRSLLGRKLVPLLRRASICCCGNEYLESYARQYCRRTMVVPTVVDTDVYVPSGERREGLPVIGWIGSPTTAPYLEPLLPLLGDLAATGRARVKIVGAGARAPRVDGVDFVDWSEEREVAEVQSMDIGIMPVPDDKWARGKSGYKLVQYMACGLPVIASPVGVNRSIVEEGVNGFLATGVEEWQAALERLLGDADLRARLGAEGRRRAVDQYSLRSQAPRLIEAMRSALQEPA